MKQKRQYFPWIIAALLVGVPLALAVPGATRFSSIQVSSQATSGIPASAGGFWWDGSTIGPLWRRADGTDLRVGGSTLQSVYNSGAVANPTTVTFDSTHNGIVFIDTSTPISSSVLLGVFNQGGTVQYFSVLGSGQSATYPGIRVYQHINSWNSNTLYLGDDSSQTNAVSLGAAGGPNVTVANNLTVVGTTTLAGVTSTAVDRANAGTFAVCGTNCTTLTLGHAGVAMTGVPTTYSMTPSSTLTLTAGAASTWDTADGTVKGATFDRTTAGTLNIGGTATAVAFANNVSSVVLGGGTLSFSSSVGNKTINVVNAPTDTIGNQLSIAAGSAGAASTATGKAGGVLTVVTGVGGAASASFAGGPSGQLIVASNNGGAGSAAQVAGAGANVSVASGAGGANNGGGGAISGSINLNVGAATGAAAQGRVNFQNNGTTDIAYYPALHALLSNTQFTAFLGSAGGGEWGDVYSRHYHSGGTAPAIAVGSAAQLGASPAAVVTAGTDASGTVTFTSGTAPSPFVANTAVIIGTITFNATYASAPRGITVTPAGSTAAALSTGASGIAFYAEQSSAAATTFIIKAVSSGTPTLAASTAYPVAYMVIQ